MSTPYKIGVILVNYRDYCDKFLEDARDSLRKLNYPKDRYNVYIVDNESTPESWNRLRTLYKEARIIVTDGNGWGHANNLGIERAFQDKCDMILLSNMDVVFDPDCLIKLVETANLDDRIGIVQPKILLYPKNKDGYHINSLGNNFHFLGFGFCDGYNLPDNWSITTRVSDIGYASGACMLIKKKVIDSIGGCDEEYFMYHDDLELSLKAKRAGFRVVLAPSAVMYHKYEFSRSVKQVYYMERNRYLTLFTFFSWRTLLLFTPALLAMEAGIWIHAYSSGWSKAKTKANKYFFRKDTWKKILKTRKSLQKSSQLPDKELVKDMVGKIEFQEIDNPLLKYIGNPLINGYFMIAKKLIVW